MFGLAPGFVKRGICGGEHARKAFISKEIVDIVGRFDMVGPFIRRRRHYRVESSG
jgi:hypothetical protein